MEWPFLLIFHFLLSPICVHRALNIIEDPDVLLIDLTVNLQVVHSKKKRLCFKVSLVIIS